MRLAPPFQRAVRLPGAVAAMSLCVAGSGLAQGPDVKWIAGPATVDLGKEAEVKLGEPYVFAAAEDTRRLMEAMGNVVDNTEVGLISPRGKDQDWIMVFEYHRVGYVKDDEKDRIDKNALFASIREGTEQANRFRKEKGMPGLHVVSWQEEPNYDPKTHDLQWALLARDDNGREVVNYNVRLLGRGGYMSVTLVDDPQKLAASKPEVQHVLSGFSYKKGKTYAEFVKGDKVAEYGLAALVAGGAGAAAVKFGFFAALGKFFAKAGKAVVVGIVALLAMLKKAVGAIFGRRGEERQV